MINYTYKITTLATTELYSAMPTLVVRVDVLVTGLDIPTDRKISMSTVVFLPVDSTPDAFIAYDLLTEETVIGWIAGTDEIAAIQLQIAQGFAFVQPEPVPMNDTRFPPWIPAVPPEPVVVAPPPYIPPTSNPAYLINSSAVSDEHIKALVYQVLEEIRASQV